MSEKVDQVAKEVMVELHKTIGLDITIGLARNVARAAIKAMRNPDEVMIQRAYEAVEADDRWQIEDGRDFLKAYHAVLDTALS